MLPAALLLLSAPEPTPIGHWINPGQTVIVEILECGAGAICGRVRWASDQAIADAGAAGTETLVGTELFDHFVPNGEGRWKGKLFVPDLRRAHAAELRLVDRQRLKVSGCAVGRLICKSQSWTRVDPPPSNQQ